MVYRHGRLFLTSRAVDESKRAPTGIDNRRGVLFVLITRDFLIARSAHRGIIWIAKIFVLESHLPI